MILDPGQIAEDKNGYVIANVKRKPDNDNGYVQANVYDQPNVVDESGYAVMVVNQDIMAKDKDGCLTPKANHEKRIYVNAILLIIAQLVTPFF